MSIILPRRLLRYSSSTTFYRRELPKTLHPFTSQAGKNIFRNALAQGNAEIFFALSGNFTMQSEPAFCGLGSLSMVLNALSVDPGKRWKGVWRWYSDEMLECCAPLELIKKQGLTFHQLASTARGNGLHVVAKQANHTSYKEFQEDLSMVCRSDDVHMVVSFSRTALGQTGDGHFSPIGAFSESDDQVLVMDTARFKYPSYFVDSKVLYDAMHPIDTVTQLPRGYLLLSKGNSKPLPICRIVAHKLEWRELTDIFWNKIPIRLKGVNDNRSMIKTILNSIPHKYHFYTSINTIGVDLAGNFDGNKELQKQLGLELQTLLSDTKRHPIYENVSKIEMDCIDCKQEIKLELPSFMHSLATLFMLSLPRDLLSQLPSNVCRFLLGMREDHRFDGLDLLREEVARMNLQWESLIAGYCTCGLPNCTKNN